MVNRSCLSSQLVTDVIRLSYFPDQSCNSRGMLLVIVRTMNILKTLSFSSLQECGTKFILQIGTLNPHGINERVSFNSIYSYFSRCHVTTNSVAPTLLQKLHLTHNSSIRSDEGLTLGTSAFRISVRWPIYIINSVDKTKFLYTTSPPTQHHSFFRNYPLLFLVTSHILGMRPSC